MLKQRDNCRSKVREDEGIVGEEKTFLPPVHAKSLGARELTGKIQINKRRLFIWEITKEVVL